MLETLFVDQLWLALLVWAAVYISDYSLTIYTARLYQAAASQHFSYGGSLELTPVFQRDVNSLRRFSPRFALFLLGSCLALALLWFWSVRWLRAPAFFALALGGLMLRETAVHIRHLRNIVTYRYARSPGNLQGRIEFSRRLVLRQSAVELLGFATMFLFASLVAGSWFILGGALACAVTGLQHWRLATRATSQPERTMS